MQTFNESTFQALEFIRQVFTDRPAVSEKLCFETPAFYVCNKLMARMREDGKTLALYNEERDIWIKKDPKSFFIAPHYDHYKYVVVSLEHVDPVELKQLLLSAWEKRATKTVVKQYNANL